MGQTITEFSVFNINSIAFNNMMSSNDISIISNKPLRLQLSKYYAQDPLYGTQERVKTFSRKFADYITPKMMNKEALNNYLKVNTFLPKRNENREFRGDVEFYDFYFKVIVTIDVQNEFVNIQKETITRLIESIDQQL